MAHKKAAAQAAMDEIVIPAVGIKKFGGELVRSGNILIRQRGTRIHPGRMSAAGRMILFCYD